MRRSIKTAAGLFVLLFSMNAVAAEPTDAHYFKGVAAYESGNYDKAVSELNDSIAAKPTPKAALYLGNALLKLGKLQPAKDALNLVLKLDPNSSKKAGILQLIRSIDARTLSRVTITSSPPGATVYLDSETKNASGKTPVNLTVAAGQHKVTLVLEGYDRVSRDEQMTAGDPIKINYPLLIKGCDVTVTGGAKGAQASAEGGAPVPVPGTIRVAKGAHTITVTAPGFDNKDLAAQCDGKSPLALAALLTPSLAKGMVEIPSMNDPGTVVEIDGKVVTVSAADAQKGIGLPIGRHKVTIMAPNLPPYTTSVDVVADAATPVSAPVDPFGAKDTLALYVGAEGAGNIALRDWNLGSNSYVSQDGTRGAHPGSSGMAGVRVGLRIVPRFSVEGEFAFMELPNSLGSSSGVTYDLNAVYAFLTGRWTPVVEGGVGVYQVVSGKLGSDQDVRVHLGVGARVKILEWLSARVDVRDVASRGFDGVGSNNVEIIGGLEAFVWHKKPAALSVEPAAKNESKSIVF